jgi:hypothetical protein
MEFREAVLQVLNEEHAALHWTVIQDLALKRGYLDPFTQRDIRANVIGALRQAVNDGEVVRAGTGMYELAP